MRRIGQVNREKICADYSWQRIVDEYEQHGYLHAVSATQTAT